MRSLACLSLLVLSLAACTSDGASATDAAVTFVDSAPPDAPLPACSMTQCGAECVDTATSSNHCGGCGLACDSPGQICTGSLPCACPEPFVPATVDPAFGDQVTDQFVEGVNVAIGPILGDKISMFMVGYDALTPIGEDIALTSALGVPLVGAGYDIDIQAMTAKTGYQAIAGTLHLDSACSTGAFGTATDVTFAEVTLALPPTVVDGGCQFTVPAIAFSIGAACTPP